MKRLSLELGGKSPNVLLADADLDAAARGAVSGIFCNKGEVRAAGSRLLVAAAVHDALVERVVERARMLVPADPLDPKCRMGPVARRLKAGTVWVNAYDAYGPAAPFGGTKQSGFGREPGEHALEQYTQDKTVWVDWGGGA